jgi:membrane protein
MTEQDQHNADHALLPNTGFQTSLKNVLSSSLNVYSKQRYNTPLFIFYEMLKAFNRHNVLGLSASLSFYALFALIPLVLLMFFLLSHLVFSSDYAIVQLAIITGNLVPKFSNTIMLEVYNAAQQKAAWGAAGLFVLLWAVTPLAAAMRASFYNIAALVEAPSFIQRKIKDMIAVIGMLLLFFLFTFAGMMLEKVLHFIGANSQWLQYGILTTITSLIITTALISLFYYAFFPIRLNIKHIFIGAFFTAVLWLLMRPAFSLFLSMNQSYGSVFGSMKNLFISITWLYFNFIVFLIGTELIATLRKQDVLLLKGLFNELASSNRSSSAPTQPPINNNYLAKLMQRYGQVYQHGDYLYHVGNQAHCMYYIVRGEVDLIQNGLVTRHASAGDYLGEIALLSQLPTIVDAVVSSDQAEILIISPDNIETLLLDEPTVAMQFLRQMATRFQVRHQ